MGLAGLLTTLVLFQIFLTKKPCIWFWTVEFWMMIFQIAYVETLASVYFQQLVLLLELTWNKCSHNCSHCHCSYLLVKWADLLLFAWWTAEQMGWPYIDACPFTRLIIEQTCPAQLCSRWVVPANRSQHKISEPNRCLPISLLAWSLLHILDFILYESPSQP